MKYPEILGHNIELLPAKYRSAEWFEALPVEIHRQFYWTVKRYKLEVAAEYLRDNHGCDDSQCWKSTKKQGSKFGDVRGEIFAGNTFRFHFEDGAQDFYIKQNPSEWRFVGYIDINGLRIVRTSSDSCYIRAKLAASVKKAVDGGALSSAISEPMIFNLTLTVAEDIRASAA